MEKEPRVFIVILNWNRAADTEECLEAVRRLDYGNYGVILIDNGSSEKESKMLGGKHPEVIFAENENNLGFSGGNNRGIKIAMERGADYVLILSNDVVVEKQSLREMIRAGELQTRCGVLGPLNFYYHRPDKIISSGGKIAWLPAKPYQMTDVPEGPRKSDYVYGCAMLVKKSVIEKTGLFDERFFTFYEDSDWCVRMRKAGFDAVVVPQARVLHKQSVTTGSVFSPLALYYGARNRLLFMKKNAALPVYLVFLFFIFPFTVIKNILRWRGRKTELKYFIRGILDFAKGKFGQYAYSD